MDNKLEEYSEELGLNTPFTLESLIESHRNIRAARFATEEERLKYVRSGYAAGYESGMKAAIEFGSIPVEKLKGMTVAELVEILRDD